MEVPWVARDRPAKWENGALDRTRTYDPQLRKLMLYPLSYERFLRLMIPQGSLGSNPLAIAGHGHPSIPQRSPRRLA